MPRANPDPEAPYGRCACGCGTPLQPPASPSGRTRKWVSDAHRKRGEKRAARLAAEAAAERNRRRTARDRYGWSPSTGEGSPGTTAALLAELRRAGATDSELRGILGLKPDDALPLVPDPADAPGDMLREDPAELVSALLRRTQLAWRLYAESALRETGSVRVRAVAGMLEADAKATSLLQHVGRLPKDLGSLRHLLEVRGAARELLSAVEGLEAGTLSPGDVRAVLLRYAGLPGPEDLSSPPPAGGPGELPPGGPEEDSPRPLRAA